MSMKWAKVIDEKTKACEVGTGTNSEYYRQQGYRYISVEQSDNGSWYLTGYAPITPKPTENELKIEALKKELATYDYIGVKIATGCATIEEYADKIAYCESLRKEIRRLSNETTTVNQGVV